MKESKKGLIILFVLFLCLSLWAFFQHIDFGSTFKNNLNYQKNKLIEVYNFNCVENHFEDERTQKLCSIDITGLPGSSDTYTIFYQMLRNTVLEYLIFFDFIIIITFSIYNINKRMKSKYLYYYTQRKKYSNFIKEMILSTYKYVLVVPFFVIVLYLLSLTISNHGPNNLTTFVGYATFDSIHYETKYFLALFTVYIMLMWLFYINIGLVVQSKNRKFIFTLIECLIIYFLLEIVAESESSYFWIIDIYNPETYSIYSYIGFGLICFSISFILVILAYMNKEKILKRVGD